jgi:AcrR family transcriptional regulator
MSPKTDTKEQILRAVANIINTDGVFSLTLEAVAKSAGISKGGLLYHFPSKDALLTGMVDYLLQGFIDGMESMVNEAICEKGKWTRAYIALTFNQLDSEIDMNTAFLAAVATNPELLQPMAKYLQGLHSHIENDNINPIISTVIRLAVDGMYFNQLYGMNLQEDTRKKVLKYLTALTKEAIE